METIQKNKRNSIINGAHSIIANSYNGFLALYAINILHANHQQVGLLNSLPAIISLITTIVGGYWFSRLKVKKRFCGISIMSARFFLLFIALVPFLPAYQAWILVILIGLMNVPGSLTNLSWQSLIGDLIPEKDRGQFFSTRNRILTFVGMIATAIIGVIMNFFDKNNPIPFQALFIIAFIFGVLEAYYLFKHEEIQTTSEEKSATTKLLSSLKEILKQKPFLFFLISSMLFNFGWQMAWPLFSIYQIQYAGATAIWLSMFAVSNQLSQILTYKWWGSMSDKFGNGIMLVAATIGMASAPVLTVLSNNLIYLTVVNLFTGIFLAGTNLLLFNQLLSVATENRSPYITLYTISIGFIGFLAPQFGVFLLGHLGMSWTMGISSMLRISGSLAFFIVFVILLGNRKFFVRKS